MTSQTTNAELARRLEAALRPLAAPMAITFHRDAPPPEITPLAQAFPPPNEAGRTGAVSAGCVFWMMGPERTFSTTPADHANCSVGSLTHGLLSFEEAAKRDDTCTVLEVGWVSGEDAASLATVKERPESIVYGPLAEAQEVDVVFLRIQGQSLMTLRDAFPDLRMEGKPQCHIVAIAKEENVPAVSVGCALSRVRTGMGAEEMTCALPGRRLGELVEIIEKTVALNGIVEGYAAEDAKRFDT